MEGKGGEEPEDEAPPPLPAALFSGATTPAPHSIGRRRRDEQSANPLAPTLGTNFTEFITEFRCRLPRQETRHSSLVLSFALIDALNVTTPAPTAGESEKNSVQLGKTG